MGADRQILCDKHNTLYVGSHNYFTFESKTDYTPQHHIRQN